MTAKLAELNVVGGMKTSIFNGGKPKTKPVTTSDLKRWRNRVVTIVGERNAEAVIDGTWAVVFRLGASCE